MKRILVLDDDPTLLPIMTATLRGPGVEVITCRELEAAEAVLDSLPVDLMVTDLCVSPLGGLDGVRLIKHLSTHFPEMRLVVVSGQTDPDVVGLCRRTAQAAFFPKPANLPALRGHVWESLWPDGPPAGGQEERAADLEELDAFLARGAVRALFQPILPLGTDDAASPPLGYESLARGPQGSLLQNPEILFAYAARKERLYETDALCLRAALEESSGLPPGSCLFLNVQPRSLSRPGFSDALARQVEAAGCSTRRVVLELTEQQTILNHAAFAAALGALRRRGFRIALDDYGTGTSNLQLLDQLRPDYLKISGHFCRGLNVYRSKQVIVAHTARMASGLGIPTILEQVETPEERDEARRLGVAFGQGYLFARPAPARDFRAAPARPVAASAPK